MKKDRSRFVFSLVAAAACLSACSGGGAGSSAVPTSASTPAASSTKFALQYNGSLSSKSVLRSSLKSLAGTAVTVAYNGAVVGSGQLDASGAVTITLDASVPAGATVDVTAGSTTITFVVAQPSAGIAVLVQVNPDGTLSVTTSSGTTPNASPSPDDPNGSESTEEPNGTPTTVNDGNGDSALPANLPIIVTHDCQTVTIAPASGQTFARLRFEENVHDGDHGSRFAYDGAFSGAMTFPLVSQAARLHVQLFDANHHQVLELQAPMTAFTASAGSATPAPCPSVSPSATPTPSGGDSPSPSPSPSASPSALPTVTPAPTTSP